MHDPIFGIDAEDINPFALQSKFVKALARYQIELSEPTLTQLFFGVHQKSNEEIPTAYLPFPLTSTFKGARNHAKKFHSILKLAKPGIKLGQAQAIYANTFGYKQWESMAIALREFEAKRSAV